MDLPQGRVTYLLTDIEGSSPLWESAREAMLRAVPRHADLLEAAVLRHGGTIVKEKGEGDSLFAVFPSAADAVASAHEAQRALCAENWPTETPIRVRMALYTGEADLRAGDYYGDAVNRCGRLRAVARGGQVLLGQDTAAEAQAAGVSELSFLDLGSHLLRDLVRPERIFQLCGPGLPADFAPIKAVDVVPTNLPYRRNPGFVGRDQTLKQLTGALAVDEPKPVALTGMTGIGKTQAAVEFGLSHMMDFPSGVFWVHGSDTLRLTHDMASLGGFLGLRGGADPEDRAQQVRNRLQRLPEPALLICDGVTDDTDLSVLPAIGECRVLLTTTNRNVVPHGFHAVPLDVLSESASLSVLQMRRSAVNADDLAAARELAGILGNLPLALALVAHHVDRLAISFAAYRDMLVKGPIHLLTRARLRFTSDTGHSGAIYDAIAIAYASLNDTARRFLRTASCFATRGIPPELVCSSDSSVDRFGCEEAVADLLDESMAVREEDGRLSLHQLVRYFARGLMSPAELQQVVTGVAAVLTAEHVRANEAMRWDQAHRDVDHCRSVADLCRQSGLDEVLYPLLLEMGTHLFHLADFRSAASSFKEGLTIADRLYSRRSRVAAVFLRKLSEAQQHLHDATAAQHSALEALRIAQEVLPPEDPAICEYKLSAGYVFSNQGDLPAALEYYQSALADAERTGGPESAEVATCQNNIGAVLWKQGRPEEALRRFQAALEIDEAQLGRDHYKVAIRLNNVGRVLGDTGRWEDALTKHEEAVRIYEAAYGRRSHPDVAASLYFVARARRHLGLVEEARANLAEAREILARFYDDTHTLCRWVQEEIEACS